MENFNDSGHQLGGVLDTVTKSMTNQQNQLLQDNLKSLTGQIRKP